MQLIIDFNEKKAGGFFVLHKRHLLVATLAFLVLLSAVVYVAAYQVARYWVVSENPRIVAVVHDEMADINKDRWRLWNENIGAIKRDIAGFNARLIGLAQHGQAIANYLDLPEDAVLPNEQLCASDETSDEATTDKAPEDAAVRLSGKLFNHTQTLDALERRYQAFAGQAIRHTVLEKTTPVKRPVQGKHWLASGFGYRRDPFTGRRAFHAGTDYAARSGTPVVAAAAGVVIYAGRLGNYGNAIHIYHGDKVSSLYGHLKDFNVQLFQYVDQGEIIGSVGSTGRSTGPHLHYEVRIDKRSRPLNKTIKTLRKARNLS